MKTILQQKEAALAEFLGIKRNEISQSTYDENTFDADGGEYLVLTDEEADEKAAEYIKDSLWAFNADFILSECELPFELKEGIQAGQEKQCESANDWIESLIEKTCGIESFIESAISADGRGHFMSSYDGEESEQGDFFIYRVN